MHRSLTRGVTNLRRPGAIQALRGGRRIGGVGIDLSLKGLGQHPTGAVRRISLTTSRHCGPISTANGTRNSVSVGRPFLTGDAVSIVFVPTKIIRTYAPPTSSTYSSIARSDGYEIAGALGHGGMARVYLGCNVSGHWVADKVLLPMRFARLGLPETVQWERRPITSTGSTSENVPDSPGSRSGE